MQNQRKLLKECCASEVQRLSSRNYHINVTRSQKIIDKANLAKLKAENTSVLIRITEASIDFAPMSFRTDLSLALLRCSSKDEKRLVTSNANALYRKTLLEE